MAIYLGTALISQVIGKLGVNDFMRWRNKLVVRMSPITVTDPNSPAQRVIREAMQALGPLWFDVLTADQRNAWETLALLRGRFQDLPQGIRRIPQGNGGSYTGYQAFQMINLLLASAGLDPVADPPLTSAKPDCIESFDLTWDEATLSFIATWIAPSVYEVGARVRIWLDSEQELFHRQIWLKPLVADETATAPTVKAALGNDTNFTDFRESYVLAQCDVFNPSGSYSARTETLKVLIPAAP
jgi:hypothetical protein